MAKKSTYQPELVNRNLEMISARQNHCVRCGDGTVENMTKHHVVPTRFRRHLPDYLKDNNHKYVVLLCRSCHDEYGIYENKLNNVIAQELGVMSFDKYFDSIFIEKRKIVGIADALLLQTGIPTERVRELMLDFSRRTGMPPTLDNLHKVRQRKYEPIPDSQSFGYLILERVPNYYVFQQRWLEHFVSTMKPSHLPSDLKILLDRDDFPELFSGN